MDPNHHKLSQSRVKIPLQHPGFCGKPREKIPDYFPIVAISTHCELLLLLNNLNLSVMITAAGIQKGIHMETALFLLGALIFWFVLNKWILPKLGIPT
jgi:hypothetical protein